MGHIDDFFEEDYNKDVIAKEVKIEEINLTNIMDPSVERSDTAILLSGSILRNIELERKIKDLSVLEIGNRAIIKEQDIKIAKLEFQLAHWQSNVKEIAKQCRILRDRPDLPIDRTEAYQELVRLQERVRELELVEQRYNHLTHIQGNR